MLGSGEGGLGRNRIRSIAHRRRRRGQEVGRLAPPSQRGACPQGEMPVRRVGVLLGGVVVFCRWPLVCHVRARRVRVSADVRVEWPDRQERQGGVVLSFFAAIITAIGAQF